MSWQSLLDLDDSLLIKQEFPDLTWPLIGQLKSKTPTPSPQEYMYPTHCLQKQHSTQAHMIHIQIVNHDGERGSPSQWLGEQSRRQKKSAKSTWKDWEAVSYSWTRQMFLSNPTNIKPFSSSKRKSSKQVKFNSQECPSVVLVSSLYTCGDETKSQQFHRTNLYDSHTMYSQELQCYY